MHADGIPRVVERDGEALAVIISPEDYAALLSEPRSRRLKHNRLALAGAWSDIDPEEFKAFIYCAREEGTRPIDEP